MESGVCSGSLNDISARVGRHWHKMSINIEGRWKSGFRRDLPIEPSLPLVRHRLSLTCIIRTPRQILVGCHIERPRTEQTKDSSPPRFVIQYEERHTDDRKGL